jgi:DNA adenine methylase
MDSLEAQARPFLKWAGGKRWLTSKLSTALPLKFGKYFEPFLGSGASFFSIAPNNATLSDSNKELITTYNVIKDKPEAVVAGLRRLQNAHSKEFYYTMRSKKPRTDLSTALRFLYLNRTCFNGLYRVNKKNEFNVLAGTKNTVVMGDDDFFSVSAALKSAVIINSDFEPIIQSAKREDLIYVDPPYTVKHNLNGFIKYNQSIFSWDDQVRLNRSLVDAKNRGCHIIISNADHSSIRDLYAENFYCESVTRHSVISGSSEFRGITSELLMVHHA